MSLLVYISCFLKIRTPAEAKAQQPQKRGRTSWKTTQDLGLTGSTTIEWNRYVTKLVICFIHLEEETDTRIWTKNCKDGSFFAKLGYDDAMEREQEGNNHWWWTKIWKILGPLKTFLTLWLALSNKLLTWEILIKRGFQVPGVRMSCKVEN